MAELESFWLELAEPKAKSEGVCDAGVAKSKEAADSDFPPFSEPFDGFFKKPPKVVENHQFLAYFEKPSKIGHFCLKSV